MIQKSLEERQSSHLNTDELKFEFLENLGLAILGDRRKYVYEVYEV